MKPEFDGRSGHIVYPASNEVRKAAKAAKLSDEIDVQRLKLLGHILRRGAHDPVRCSFMYEFPRNGRPSITIHSLKGQLQSLMDEANLSTEDALNRVKWRSGVRKFLEKRRKAAFQAGRTQQH